MLQASSHRTVWVGQRSWGSSAPFLASRSRRTAAPQQQHFQQHGISQPKPPALVCSARRGRSDADGEAFSYTDFSGKRVSVSKGTAWSFLVPAATVLGFFAMIGPLVMGVTAVAVAVGAAAVGAGMLMFSWVALPIIAVAMLFPLLMFPLGFFLLPAAGLGITVVSSAVQLATWAAVLGFAALGWSAVTRMLQGNKQAASSAEASTRSGSTSSTDGPVVQAQSRLLSQEEEEIARISRELRDFDTLLAEREERKRVDEWRKSRL